MLEFNIDTWRILYSLSLFMMGTAVLARATAYPISAFRNRLLSLGLFGLIHATGTSFRYLGLADEGAAAHVRTFLYSSSYIALFYFAIGWRQSFPHAVHYIAALTISLWGIMVFLHFQQETEFVRRLVSGVPAATFAAIAIIWDKDFQFENRFPQHMKWAVAAGFAVYAVLQFPAAGDSIVLGSLSVPVLDARAASVLMLTLATLMLLNRFDTVLRQQGREALEEVGKKLSNAMEIGKLGTWEKNLITGETSWSKHLFWLLGESPDAFEPNHATFLDRVYQDDRAMLDRAQTDALKNLSSYEFHYRIVRSDNSIRYIQEAGSVLLARDGRAHKMLGVLVDITELTEARIEAERASRAKSNFLANLSHELRTPLNAIIGFGELLQLGLKKENSEEYGGHIKESGRHLLSLINDILDLSKISAGKWILDERPVDLRTVAVSCMELMVGNADTTDEEVIVDMPEDLPPILADERSIRQILVNLASNSAKNTPKGGKITLFAKQLPKGELSFGVADTGSGISEADQKKVFEEFSQAERDASRAAKGTGLGLPIVKGLAAAHGGRVSLWSRVGQGTCVTVVLPSKRVLRGEISNAA